MPDGHAPVTRRERERNITLTRFYGRLRALTAEALDFGLSEDDLRLAIQSAIDDHNAAKA